MAVEELREARGADLFFAFDQEGDAQGQVREALEQAGERGDRDEVRALVVRGAAAQILPSRTTGSKAGEVQRFSGSAGWTS
jgi:hypothetical protein